MLAIEIRSRTTVWDLLGNVGGFKEGLMIVVSLLMTPYSEFAFKMDYMANNSVDKDSADTSTKAKAFKHSTYYRKTAKALQTEEQMKASFAFDTDVKQVFNWALGRSKTLKTTFFEALKQIVCCNKKNRKQRMLIVEQIDRHLDLRNIIQSQLTLAMLLKRTLTKDQRLLLAWQRDRLPALYLDSEDEGDLSTSGGDDFAAQAKRDPKHVKGFMKQMKEFAPETDLDRRLLRGVIDRDRFLAKSEYLA